MDNLDSFDFDGFTCFMKNRSIYKRESGGGWIALLLRNLILNVVKIDFQRRTEKSLHKFCCFVDFCVYNDVLFLNYRNKLLVFYIHLQRGMSTVTEVLVLSWKKHFCT